MRGRKRGLFEIDPGKHSPELTTFLRRWLTPGHVPGRGPHPAPRLKADDAQANESEKYRSLGRFLCGSSVLFCLGAMAQWLWIPKDSSTLVIFGTGSVIAALLGLLAFRQSRRK
jgi:hypothetical protein